ILKDNKLRAVKSHSLEGLYLLKHLDLSGNAIKSIEERAFEPLPFLEHLNLSGNQLTQIPSGAFEAWHGMQFLQELILSQNPLAVIADIAFFKLPSVNYLDLSATQVSAETLLLFLQTTSHLETLKVPRAVSCCLCKERGAIETPCRTIQFLCENLCSTSTAQCGSLGQTQAELMAAAQSGQLRSSSVLYLTAKEVSPAQHGSVTFAVSGEQDSTDGDLSSQGDPQSDWHSSAHLSSQDSKAINELLVMLQDAQKMGGTGALRSNPSVLEERLVPELQSQQPDAQRPLAVAKAIPQQPPPARHNVQKFPVVEEKKTPGWEQKQLESGLNWPVLNLWDVDGGSNHPEEMQLESGLNLPILNLWDIAGGSNSPDNSTAFRHQGAKEAAGPRRSSVRVYQRRQRDTSSQLRHNPLFYQGPGNVRGEEEPRPRESQGLDREPENFFDLWLKSHPEESAEEERSSLGQYWKPAEPRARLPQEAGGSHSPGRAPAPAELAEARAEHHLHWRAPNEALQTFIARMTGALSAECSRPGLQLPCARMLSKTGLLAKRLNLRQESLTQQCLPPALQTGKEPAGKNAGLNHPRVTGILVFVFIMIFSIVFVLILMVLYLMQHAGEFRWFEAQTILLMEEDARVLRIHNWHRKTEEYLAAAAAKENNPGQQDK
ncbi:uncharacterized protein LOC114069210, partial [Empidonax traillii]|uniref:uncharacterized protein LOC114069210 n=1 Tax=Empidonax traillii TaxID=164674 RepID=UPI000FFD3929